MDLNCYDCGLPYSSEKWCDVFVPNEIWAKITPSEHPHGGLLCFNCIAGRIKNLCLDNVPIKITSGPWDFSKSCFY